MENETGTLSQESGARDALTGRHHAVGVNVPGPGRAPAAGRQAEGGGAVSPLDEGAKL